MWFKRKSSLQFSSRDKLIGMIANTIEHVLSENGYEFFSSGYIVIMASGVGFVRTQEAKNRQDVLFSFGITEIEPSHLMFRDDIYGKAEGTAKTFIVDMYARKVHELLMSNFSAYHELKYLNPSFADL
jgi:hypothetical protein